MPEIGEVIEIKDHHVVVALERNEACGKCKACSAGLQTTQMILEAENQCEAVKGDMVEIYLKETNFVKAVLIMYTLPLIGLLIGLGIGALLFDEELLIIGMGILLTGIAFVLIRVNEKRFKTEAYRPVAIKNYSKPTG